MKRIVILPAAAKSLRKYRSEAAWLVGKLEAYARKPESQKNNVSALKGSTALRLRVGDFRIVFGETTDEIIVTRIGPRGSVYE